MSAITWIKSDPTDGSNASAVDDAFRSLMSNFAGGIGQSFYWPGTGGGSADSAGLAKAGTARVASTNTPTGGYADGFVALDATDTTLFHNGSTFTTLFGHGGMLARNSGMTFPQVARWVAQDTQLFFSSTSVVHGDFSPAYRSAPVVFLSSNNSNTRVGLLEVDASGFTSVISTVGGIPLSVIVYAYAEGLVTL